jgi:N-acetylmuramoyl-L-alanine amidase CwlA
MNIVDAYLTKGKPCRPGTPIKPIGILIHYVGNPGTSAMNNRNYFENNTSSSHYIVGLNGEVLRLIPEDELSNSAGKAYAPKYEDMAKVNNKLYISIEVCHNDASGRFSEKTINALMELVQDICKRRGFKSNDVLRHYDRTGKSCPLYYVNHPEEWTRLRELCTVGTETTVNVNVDGKVQAIPAKLINWTWYSDLSEISKLTTKQCSIRAALEGCGYQVDWINNVIVAK